MFYLKNKHFTRWTKKQGISDAMLKEAIKEFESGLFEANLGNHLFKKRIASPGRGKSGGSRTILFYQKGKKLIFCFGFEKNQQSNLSNSEIILLNKLSDNYQNMAEEELIDDIKTKDFEVLRMEEGSNGKHY